MVIKEKVLVMDLDGTLCLGKAKGETYADVQPRKDVVATLRRYREQGFHIIIATARTMRTYEGDIGKINKHTLPEIVTWLHRHDIPFDSIHVGKPWQGKGGFYVDDKAIRPDEFVNLSYAEICALVGEDEAVGQ
jgi:capsule biosynthesis phosphatase